MDHPVLQWIHDSWLGESGRLVVWVFPMAEALHFIGLCLLVGLVGLIDLRLLGVARRLPVEAMHALVPWALAGFVLTILTGSTFFAVDPFRYYVIALFWIKMLLIVVAGVNLLLYRVVVVPEVETWGAGAEASTVAKAIATVSLILWVAIISAGRLIPYFEPYVE